jgi:proteasome accessory factor A
MERLVTDADIVRAITEPPADTRAFIRGLCVQRYAPLIHRIGWGRVGIHEAGHTHWVNLHSLVDGGVATINDHLLRTETLQQMLEFINAGEEC